MKHLSATTRELIHRLRTSVWSRIRGLLRQNDSDCVNALEQIAKSGEVAAIPYLCDYYASTCWPTTRATASSLKALLQRLRPKDYVWLDKHMRSSYLASVNWQQAITTKRIAGLAESPKHRSTLLGLATIHRSGYVREAATNALNVTVHDGSELPFLLVRCNDWVGQVRDVAIRATNQRITENYIVHFVHNLALVLRLGTCERFVHAELVSEICNLLSKPSAREALLARLDSSDTETRRACFDILASTKQLSPSDLIEAAKGNSDSVIRQECVKLADAELPRDQRLDVLRKFATDSAMRVRKLALRAIASGFPEAASTLLNQAMFDRSVTVRETARWHLKNRQSNCDFAALYRSAINSKSGWSLTAAIAGLGETGNADDANLIMPFLQDKTPRNRRTAINAVDRLDRSAIERYLIKLVTDISPGVSRAASVVVTKGHHRLETSALARVIAATYPRHVACNALTLLAGQQDWSAFIAIMSALGHNDAVVAEKAMASLNQWLGKSYVPAISSDERSHVARLLAESGNLISKRAGRFIEFAMRTAPSRRG